MTRSGTPLSYEDRYHLWRPCKSGEPADGRKQTTMANIVDERGYSQIFKPTGAQLIRLRRRAEAIAAEMSLPTAPEARSRTKILELGCGTGELACHLALLTGAQVTGVDLSTQFIDHARAIHQHERLTFVVADLSRIIPRAESEKCDYIVGNGILHHLYHHLDSFLPALARWLIPGGRLIFWEPNLINPYIFLIFKMPLLRRVTRLEPEEMAFSPAFIRDKMKRAGFVNVRAEPRDFLLPNTPEPLISVAINFGSVLERLPGIRFLAQSIFVSAAAAP
jgi:SAM-dependent methyltransferase